MHTQPDRMYCPFCHLTIALQEPQVSKHGQTFHESCALNANQLQQSPRLSTNAPTAESASREAVLNSSSSDDLAVQRATSNSGSVKGPSSKRSATKMVSKKKKTQTRKTVRPKPVGKALAKNQTKRLRAEASSKGGPKLKAARTKQKRRSPSRKR